MGDQTFDLVNWITQSNTEAWLQATGLTNLPITDFTSDQAFSQYLLTSGITSIKLPLTETIDNILLYYGEHKEQMDAQLKESMDFRYDIIDTFDDSG